MVETKERIDEEISQYKAHTAKLSAVTGKLEEVLKKAFQKHFDEFVKQHSEHHLSLPGRFLAQRLPNETVEDWVKRDLGWPTATTLDPNASKKREIIMESIKWFEGVMFWLTNHPIYSNRTAAWGSYYPDKSVPGVWKDEYTRDEWVDAGAERKPFKVKMRDNAQELVLKYAEKVAQHTMDVFVYKAGSKILPILLQNKNYFAGLQKCIFNLGGIEADVRVTLPDTRSFVFHIIIKYNYSSLGKPYYQYPLTYHDVYNGSDQPAKSMSQQEVYELFGVKQEDCWQPVFSVKRKARWKIPKPGDVVKFHGKKTVGFILGVARKTKGKLRILLANGKEVVATESKIKSVVSRIQVSTGNKNEKEVFKYALYNQDWTVEGPKNFDKSQGKVLQKIRSGQERGNYKKIGAKMVFQLLCDQQKFPGSNTKTVDQDLKIIE